MKKRERLQAMSGLRFLAAIQILLFHLMRSGVLDSVAPPGLLAVLETGNVNTSLFIMLSGFLLFYGYTDEEQRLRVSGRSFLVARVAQIYPVMLLGHVLTMPIMLMGPEHYGAGEALARGALAVTATQAWVPLYAFSYDAPAWTISCFVFFYALFPALVRLVGRLTVARTRALLVGCWLAALAAPMAYLVLAPGAMAQHTTDQSDAWSMFLHVSPLVWLPVFLSGVLLARLFIMGEWSSRANGPVLTLTALAGLVAAIALREHVPYVLFHNGLLLPLQLLLMVGLATGRGALARLLARPWLATLGSASLVIYLLHFPLQNILQAFLKRAWPLESPVLPILAYVVGTLYGSVLFTRHVVEPCAKWIRRRWDTAPARTASVPLPAGARQAA